MKASVSIAMMVMGLVVVSAHAGDGHAGHGMSSGHMMGSAPRMAMSEGTVKKVSKDAGKVTIAHGPLENMDMPSMTMVFRVKDADWLGRLKSGDKIRFTADKVDGAFTMVRYELAN